MDNAAGGRSVAGGGAGAGRGEARTTWTRTSVIPKCSARRSPAGAPGCAAPGWSAGSGPVLVRGNAILGKRALIADAFAGSTVQPEGIRGPEGPCLMARILAPHRHDALVHAGMDRLRAEGLAVDSPHSWVVHVDMPPRWAAADRFEPAGLLNPGKLPRE
jgi:hypothetical protein